MSIRRTRGFTVVEMLVVIAIIGVLVALLLPAVQMAREAARRIACSSKMTQLGKATINYETSKQYLPPLRAYRQGLPAMPTSHTSNPESITSWVHALLPYIERTDLHDLVLTTSDVRTIQGSIVPLVCNSDVTDMQVAGKLSYGANGGRQNNYGPSPATLPVDWPANGALDDRLKGSGESFRTFKTTLGDISNGDGTTNTIAYAENMDLYAWNDASDETYCSVLWVVNSTDQPALNKDYRPDGTSMSVYYARPASRHPGGFNVTFCDGSVKFVNESIGATVYARLMSSNGKKYKEPGSNTQTPAVLSVQTTPLAGTEY